MKKSKKPRPTKILRCPCGAELPVFGIPASYYKIEKAFWLEHFAHKRGPKETEYKGPPTAAII